MSEPNNIISIYKHRVPKSPYCTSDPKKGLKQTPKYYGINSDIVQHSPDSIINSIVLDCDYNGMGNPIGFLHVDTENVPLPNMVVTNQKSGNSHLHFMLEHPINKGDGYSKSQKYLKDMQNKLTTVYGADTGYTNFTSRSPFGVNNTPNVMQKALYDLNTLSNGLRDVVVGYKKVSLFDDTELVETSTSRNTTLFNNLRMYAYKAFSEAYKADFALWQSHLIMVAAEMNERFACPLLDDEIYRVASSVSGWSYEHSRTIEQFIIDTHTSEIQKLRSVKGNAVKKQKATERVFKLQQLMIDNPMITNEHLASILDTSVRSIQYDKKKLKGMSSSFLPLLSTINMSLVL